MFGDRQDTEDLQRVRAAYDEHPTVKSIMKVALMGLASRYVSSNGPNLASDERTTLTALRAKIKDRCTDCHHTWEDQLVAGNLPKPVAQDMLVKVAFGIMPKAPAELGAAARTEIVHGLIEHIWSDPKERKRALDFYLYRMRAIGTTDLASALSAVHNNIGSDSGLDWRFNTLEPVVSSDQLQYTPGLAATIGIDALGACKKLGKSGESLASCLKQAVHTTEFMRTPLPDSK